MNDRININLLSAFSNHTVEKLLRNVAANGHATQVADSHHGHYASYALDGIFSTNVETGARCAMTQKVSGAWWQVDLVTTYTIVKIAVTTTQENGNISLFPKLTTVTLRVYCEALNSALP